MTEIEWDRAKRVILASPDAKTTLDLSGLPARLTWALRRRVFQTGGVVFEVMILAVIPRGELPTSDNVLHAVYWTQDGVLHTCRSYWCGQVARYARLRTMGQAGDLQAACHE